MDSFWSTVFYDVIVGSVVMLAALLLLTPVLLFVLALTFGVSPRILDAFRVLVWTVGIGCFYRLVSDYFVPSVLGVLPLLLVMLTLWCYALLGDGRHYVRLYRLQQAAKQTTIVPLPYRL